MPDWNKLLNFTLKGKVDKFWQHKTWRRFVAAIVFFVAYSAIIGINFLPENITLKIGQVAPKLFTANRSVEYIDELATEEAKKLAEESILPVYDLDRGVSEDVQLNIQTFFREVEALRAKKQATDQGNQQTNSEANQQANQQANQGEPKALPIELNETEKGFLLKASNESLRLVEETAMQLARQALTDGIEEDKLSAVKDQLSLRVDEMILRADQKAIIKLTLNNYLEPNKIFNEMETQRRVREAREAVQPITRTIQQDQKIIGEGEIVDQETMQKLKALGFVRQKSGFAVIIGIMLMIAIHILLIMTYIYNFRRDVYENDNLLILLGIIGVITLLIMRGVLAISLADEPEVTSLIGYLVPVSAAAMLVAVLVDSRISIIISIVLNIWLGIFTDFQLRFALVGLVTSLVSIYSVSKLSQRSDLAKAGLLNVGVSAVATIIAIGMITEMDITLVSMGIILGVANGIFSAVLTGGFLPYLETAFGITSSVKLLELSNPNNPLLKRLLLEAPGTYHHSIIVGNLAETAADAVGADSLMVRVGAMYHDIGKVKRPYFFIENQIGLENPHDKLAPSLSTLIITSHIKDGVELAKESKLPQSLIHIIEEHHGTSLVSFFYHKAKDNDKNISISEADYRYDGPKPQSKEAALVMLADTVEAAVRSAQTTHLGKIEGIVRKVIKDKLADGQLDECDLTFRDLDIIANAFMKVLNGIYHNRIEYPDQVLKEMERRKENSGN